MSTLQQKKGPAEAATSPSHGSSNPSQGNENMQTDSMPAPAAPEFPIPYAMQGPYDDLRDALALLDLIDRFFDDGWHHGISKENVANLSVAFAMARSNLRTVAAFLEADKRDDTRDLYRRVRREQISACYERGMA
ncbi:hypothetical protein ACTDI4_18095 [Mesorhizobium sp. PUT5]|uniref:hypothetical protein n=1 Tax=Mesorhizobium sp. PUT5 TaxID=3454629 RepID=UPI003FA40972